MGQLTLFELIQTPSAAAAAARRQGPVAFGNGNAGLRLRTTRRTKGSAHIAHAHTPYILTELKTFGQIL